MVRTIYFVPVRTIQSFPSSYASANDSTTIIIIPRLLSSDFIWHYTNIGSLCAGFSDLSVFLANPFLKALYPSLSSSYTILLSISILKQDYNAANIRWASIFIVDDSNYPAYNYTMRPIHFMFHIYMQILCIFY